MRTLLVLSIFLSWNSFAQFDPGNGLDLDCDGNEITGGAAEYNCTTLHVTAGTYNFPKNPAPVVRIKVTGDVIIDAGVTLNLSGDPGTQDAAGGAPGGLGGPGADDGGSNDIFGGGQNGLGPSAGTAGVSADPCGGGGGGGGGASLTNGAGKNGGTCGAQTGGPGGAFYDITVLFRGGSGGGAGGYGDSAGAFESGTGGGGGGAIWISAGGNITINGTINVTGGEGGDGTVNSGGGGGGSGGSIRIQSNAKLVNNARFLLKGGLGGEGSGAAGDGGAGGDGLYELDDADGIIDGVGTGAIGIPGESFRSSISCGTVKMKNNDLVFSILMQMMAGFMLVILISRIRGLIRRSA